MNRRTFAYQSRRGLCKCWASLGLPDKLATETCNTPLYNSLWVCIEESKSRLYIILLLALGGKYRGEIGKIVDTSSPFADIEPNLLFCSQMFCVL